MKMLQSIHSEASPEFLLKQSLAIEYKSIELWRSAIPKGSACHLDGYDKVKWAADLVHDKDMNSDSSHIKRNNELESNKRPFVNFSLNNTNSHNIVDCKSYLSKSP